MNGQPPTGRTLRKIACYIPQQEDFLQHLTVEEAMICGAQLKIPQSISLEEKRKRIQQICESLGLIQCMQTICGKLSGGERKRFGISAIYSNY